MKKASGTYYSIINPNLFLFTLIIIFILVFGAASLIAYKHYKSTLLYTIAENKSTANLLSALVYEHQKATIGILESYAQRPLFIDAIQKKDFHHILYHLKSLNEHHSEIDALFLSDQYGTVLANYPVSGESYGKNFAYRDWYKGVSKKWTPYISTVYRRLVLEKGPAVAVSVPVFDRKGKVIGILSSAQRTFFLATLIRANKLNPRKSITVLDQEGNITYGDTVDYEKEISKYLHLSLIQEAIRKGRNILEIPDPVRGRKEDILAFSPIRDVGWTVIVSEEKGAILRSETMYFIEIFAIAFLLFVCMTITPLLLRRDYQYRETKELLTQEKKLRESEVRYKELFESVHVGIAVYEAIQDGNDFIFKDFNEGGEKIDRVKRGDIIGKKVTEAFPGVAEFGLLDVFGRVWKTGNSEHHPVGIYEDQRIFGWRENYVYKLPSGEIVAVYDDVTAQKEAEDALGRAEENFRRSLDDSPLGVRIVTTEGETVYANRAILEIYGYDSIEELRTTPVKKRYTPESYAGFQIRKKKRQRGENVPSEYEISIVRTNGEVRHLQVFRKEVLWDGERQFQTIYQDITERKRAEEALRQSEERYRTVGETIPYGVWVTDPIGYCTYVSCSFLELVGMTMEQVQQFGWLQLLPPEDVEPTKKHWLHCVQTGEHFEREHRFRTKDGSYRHVLAIGRPVRGEQSQITSWVGINLDITERKQAEEEQKRLLAELEAKNREMEAFVYTVSHDLKAPLVSLNGFSSVLQKECYNQLGEEGKHYLERIQANVAHMDALIRNLLELSRIGLVVVPIEEIDVAALLREIRDELAVRLEEATAEVVVQAPLPTVRADRGRFRQVFANLMDNAVKFRSTERALRIEVGCRQEGDFYRFHVADNGIGIAPQYHEQIFAPFRKLHPEIEGVGMGLALVEKIVEHHGGRIWVESEAGKGSTFYFTIPRG